MKWVNFLFISIFTLSAFFLRIQTLPNLSDGYLLGTDAYRFFRQAELIDQHGSLPDRDMMRWLPFGRDLAQQLSLSSYLIVSLHRIFRVFSDSWTLYQTTVYYPVICYCAAIVVLYFLIVTIWNRQVALIALAIAAVIPSSLPRSFAGFADRDAFCLFLTLCMSLAYVKGIHSQRSYSAAIWTILSAIFAILLGLTWEGAGLFIAVIVLTIFTKLFFRRLTRFDAICSIGWGILIIVGLLSTTAAYRGWSNPSSPYALLTLGLPSILCVTLSIILTARFWTRFSNRLISFVPLRTGLVVLIVVGGLSAVSMALNPHTRQFATLLLDNFLSPLGESRLMQTVGELRPTSPMMWYMRYNLLFLFASAGVLLVLYELSRSGNLNRLALLAAFEILLVTVVYADWADDFLPAWAGDAVYFGAILGFIGFWVSELARARRRHSTSISQLFPEDGEKLWLIFYWFVLTLFTVRGALRYNFFFAPVAVSVAAYAFWWFQGWLLKRELSETQFTLLMALVVYSEIMVLHLQNYSVIRWMSILFMVGISGVVVREAYRQIANGHRRRLVGWIFLWAVLIGTVSVSLPLGGFAKLGRIVAQNTKPLVAPAWREALKWMRSNLPENATIASNWDYGSMINTLANRATIVDEDHYLPHQIHLAYRHLFCAQSDDEALRFLKAHGVTHLAFGHESFFKLASISFVGSNADYDRLAQPVFLAGQISMSESEGKRQWKMRLTPRQTPVSHLLFRGKTYGVNQWRMQELNLVVSQKMDMEAQFQIEQAEVTASVGENQVSLPIHRIWIAGAERQNEGDLFPGAAIIYPADEASPWQIMYVPEVGYRTIVTRLYMLEAENPHFRLIYSQRAASGMPLGVKIWQIHYPDDIVPLSRYLETDFSDAALYDSWMLGRGKYKYSQIRQTLPKALSH